MPILTRLTSLYRTLFRKAELDRELDEELRAAVDTLTARHLADGLPLDAAREAAHVEVFGAGRAEHVKGAVRSARIGAGLDACLLDLRYAWRGVLAARALTAVVVATLALGIGANTAIFSVVHAMLIEPLPYRDGDRLAFIWLNRGRGTDTRSPGLLGRGPMSGPDFRDLRTRTRTFADFAGIWASGTVPLTEGGEPEQLRAAFVTTNFFQVLGVDCALGRSFVPEDLREESGNRVVIGWGLFQRRFGGDPSIVGRRIKVNEDYATIVGVLPEAFRLLLPPDSATPDQLQVFMPFWSEMEEGPRRNLFLRVIGRMKPGVTIEQARGDVDAVGAAISRELAAARGFTTAALHDEGVREIRAPLLALFTGVGILLLVACVNVASLLIARAASRSTETAVRLALGASRGRLLRQWLVEGGLLVALGAAAGLVFGALALRVLVAMTPEPLSRLTASRIDPSVLAFTMTISIAWGLLISVAPLTELARARAGALLSGAPRMLGGRLQYRARAGLVVGQVALSVILLVGAGLLARAFVRVLNVDPGFRTERMLTFRTLVPNETFIADVQQKLAGVPGVVSTGAFSHLPYDDLPNWAVPYSLEGPIPVDAPFVDARSISPGLLETLGVPLIEGRYFTAHDREQASIPVIVDDMFARAQWPGRSALGQRFRIRHGKELATVVGVTRHMRLRRLVDDLGPQLFVPWQAAPRNPMTFVVATTGDPMALAASVRDSVKAVDKRLGIYDVRPMTGYVRSARAVRQFTLVLAGAFALAAVLLTCVGVYGVLAYAVASRRHEFGVRRALGADSRRVMGEVFREGLTLAMIGCAIGTVGASIAAQLLETQLYAVQPHDPVSFGAALAIIVFGAVVACWVPAARAVAIDPMDALGR